MATHLALLRGVNVGGKNSLSMAELRDMLESLGFTDVQTYIQSGNALFTTRTKVTASTIEGAIATRFGRDVDVALRTRTALARTIERNPFSKADASKLHIGFLSATAPNAEVRDLDHERFLPDEFAVVGADVYLHLPNGVGRSKLPPYLSRALTPPMTVRNWNTVNKLLEMAG